MKSAGRLLSIVACGMLVSSCEKQPSPSPKVVPPQPITNLAYCTEVEIDSIVRQGMPESELIRKLGAPTRAEQPTKSTKHYRYDFTYDNSPGPRRFVTTAVTVLISNDIVLGWRGSYQMIGAASTEESVVQPLYRGEGAQPLITNQQVVSLWIISDSLPAGGRYIDTPQFPNLGYVSNKPALVLHRVKSLSHGQELFRRADNTLITNQTLWLELREDQKGELLELSERNLFKLLLIMLGDKPIAAPRIESPIPGGKLVISVQDIEQSKALRDALSKILE